MDTTKIAHSTFRRFFRLAMLVAIGAALAAPGVAYAAKGGKGKSHAPAKVGLPSFSGPGQAASRAATEKALKSRKIVVVPNEDLASAAKSLHVKLDSNDGFKAVSKSLGLTAIVVGEVAKKKATLTVHTGDDGSVVGEETFQGADPHKVAVTIGKTFWKRLSGAFNKTKPPGGGGFEAPPPEEEPASAASEPEAAAEKTTDSDKGSSRSSKKTVEASEEKAKPDAEDEASEKKKPSRAAAKSSEDSEPLPEGPNEALDIFAGPAILMRSLSFNQQRNDLSDTKTANYSLPAAPVLNFRGDFYPGALSSTGLIANIGLTAEVSYLLPVVTSPGQGGNYKTSSLSWSLGGKVRLPYDLFASVSYGDEWFKLVRSSSNMALSIVPGTDYKFVRVGGGIRSQVSSTLTLMANLDYLRCLGKPGDIGGVGYFPRATCAAVDVGVGAGYKITPVFELRGGVDLRRFGLAFNVKPSDVNSDPSMSPPVAGGAVDQYIQIYVGVAYLMGGSGSSSGSTSESSESSSDKSDDTSDDTKADTKKADNKKSDKKKAAKSDDEGDDSDAEQ
ncbi:MAG TPA: hypothetical protein VGP07_11330 [Polyangia bacterium]|jgi:hypothetical protein